MDPVYLWLFGGCFALTCSAFAFTWLAHRGVGQCRDELYRYKLHAAEYFASYLHTSALENRTVNALAEIKETLRLQSSKLDRLVERGTQT